MPSLNGIDPQMLQSMLAAQQEVPRFWNTSAPQGDKPAEIVLYGLIRSISWSDDDVTLEAFNNDLQALGDAKEIVVRINSSGGEVFAAFGIYTRLKDHPARIIVKIDGWAASAATIIAMAGDEIHIPAAANFMVHLPMVTMFGRYNETELDEYKEWLSKITSSMIAAYSAKTGKTAEEIQAIMAAETTYTGEEAVANGFCDTLMFGTQAAAAQATGPDMAAFTGAISTEQANELLSRLYHPGAGGFAYNQQTQNIQTKENGHMENDAVLNVEQLEAQYPQLVASVRDAAVAAERQRIQGIEDATLAGFEALAATAKFDKPMQPGEFAMQLVAAQKQQGTAYLAGREADVKASGMENVPTASIEMPLASGEDDGSMAALDAAFDAEAANKK